MAECTKVQLAKPFDSSVVKGRKIVQIRSEIVLHVLYALCGLSTPSSHKLFTKSECRSDNWLADIADAAGAMKHIFILGLLAIIQAQVTARPESGRDRFVAHEWGTFTSVQAADGVLIEWNPFVTAELPKFVYQRDRPGESARNLSAYIGGKGAFLALQRMETPVIYFYSDQDRTVDVSVQFPQGVVTEWYPQI